MTIWVISDTHFNHANILTFTDEFNNRIRPVFTSISEMDEAIIEAWNASIAPSDKVYHLGDVVLGNNSNTWMKQHWHKLHGKKRLVLGNHDSVSLLLPYFDAIYESRDLRLFGLLLTHRPAHESQLHDYKRDRPLRNIHGHIHYQESPSPNHVNVCVERHNYSPVPLDDLRIY